MKELIVQLMGWASIHPHLAGLIVAVIACAESLAFIGLFVPGTVMMLATGALIGAGALEFWSIYAWAVGGAIVGDGVSYLLGYRYQDQFTSLQAINKRQELLLRGKMFFTRYGGKSILLARFVGPVRPIMPIVAGMLGMSPWQFYSYNVISALLWALIHLIPGMAFGASLVLAGHVAWRLALGIVVLLIFVWSVLWGAHKIYRWTRTHAAEWLSRVLAWGERYPQFTWLVNELFDPQRPALRPLALWLAVLVAGNWLFFSVLEDVVSLDPLVYAGQSFYRFLQQLRTPVSDIIMTAFTELGDVNVALPVTIAVLFWLLWHRAWREAGYWISAISFGVLAVMAIKYALHLPRPTLLYDSSESFSFPSGHVTLNTLIYGYLAVLCSRPLSPTWRWSTYAFAALLITGIALSRLYLGAHWLADVAAGMGLGTAWVALVAIARSRHAMTTPINRGLPLLAIAVFIGAATLHISNSHAMDMKRYAIQNLKHRMDFYQWWLTDWQQLSAYRIDLEGELVQPLNVQWAGDLTQLEQLLLKKGWHRPLPVTPRNVLNWLLPDPTIEELPILPQLHRGHYEALVLVHTVAPQSSSNRQIVLRMWPAMVTLVNPEKPLWYGTVTTQRIEHLPLVKFPNNENDYDNALETLDTTLNDLHYKLLQRSPLPCTEPAHWNDKVLLVTNIQE